MEDSPVEVSPVEVGPAQTNADAEPTIATDGREIGERAKATRRRLLEATRSLLRRDGLSNLRLVDITREIDASPATFYQYFADMDAALLALCDDAREDTAELLVALEEQWSTPADLERARAFVAAFVSHWEQHGTVLRVRNLKAEENVRDFRRSRQNAMLPLIERLAQMTDHSVSDGRLPTDTDGFATASAILAMLERLTAYRAELAQRGTSEDALEATLARIAFQLVSGHQP